MDTQTFFAGLQALAAFLQVWQTTRNRKEADAAYKDAKSHALESEEVREKSLRLEKSIREHPALGRLLKNRFGRCEDEFEEALRSCDNEELDKAAQEFVKCKCLIIQMIKIAEAGLDSDLQAEWDKYNCEALLSNS